MDPRQPSTHSIPSDAIAALAWKPTFHMPINAQGVAANTTVIITRLRSIASRTCGEPRVTSAGV